MKKLLLIVFLIYCNTLYSQGKKVKVLFIGNSYTAIINIPHIVSKIASDLGDTLVYETVAPGGFTLQKHSEYQSTLEQIKKGDWDYVVLQEQSQIPSLPTEQTNQMFFPYAQKLDSIIHSSNKCTKVIFYMTWGRKNGDASNCAAYPPVCTYEGMDNLIRERYEQVANFNKALLAPVGAVWRQIRNIKPELELYQSDGSHPSEQGAFASASTFYSLIFQRDVTQCKYTNGMAENDVEIINAMVKKIALDSLQFWGVNKYPTEANFEFTLQGSKIICLNKSVNADEYEWDFGDGNRSTEENPTHTFEHSGDYYITLSAKKCGIVKQIKLPVKIQISKVEIYNFIPKIFWLSYL